MAREEFAEERESFFEEANEFCRAEIRNAWQGLRQELQAENEVALELRVRNEALCSDFLRDEEELRFDIEFYRRGEAYWWHMFEEMSESSARLLVHLQGWRNYEERQAEELEAEIRWVAEIRWNEEMAEEQEEEIRRTQQ